MADRIRVVASDFDGTILKDGAQAVDSVYFPLIRSLKEKGISFIAASGRQYGNLRRLLAPVADEISYICENGALVAQGSRVLYQNEIERGLALALIADMEKTPGAEILVSCADTSCVAPADPGFTDYMRNVVKNTVTVFDSLEQVKEPMIKIALYWPDGIPQDQARRFQEKYGGRLNVADGGGGWLDFTNKGVDKGNALRYLSGVQDFSLDEVLSLGDSGNDIGMLRVAGFSYAMSTAKDEVKACADRECRLVSEVLKELLSHDGQIGPEKREQKALDMENKKQKSL